MLAISMSLGVLQCPCLSKSPSLVHPWVSQVMERHPIAWNLLDLVLNMYQLWNAIVSGLCLGNIVLRVRDRVARACYDSEPAVCTAGSRRPLTSLPHLSPSSPLLPFRYPTHVTLHSMIASQLQWSVYRQEVLSDLLGKSPERTVAMTVLPSATTTLKQLH